MKEKLSDKKVLVHDFGLFMSMAQRLSEDFAEVYYYVPWESSYPTSDKSMIGKDVPGITRVSSFWEYADKVDLICFPDVYSGQLQRYLRQNGYRVFGTDKSEFLELDRIAFRNTLEMVGLPVAPYKKIIGVENLRSHLKEVSDKWIKISAFRGDMETWHHKNYTNSITKLDKLAHKMGGYQSRQEFLVEDPVEGVEMGGDWFVSDGMFMTGTVGAEAKDLAYCCKVMKESETPKPIKKVNDRLSPVLKRFGCRGMLSTEVRIDSKLDPYCTDYTSRAGSPPSEVISGLYENYSEVIWKVAGGEFVEPAPIKKYAAQVILKSDCAPTDWLPLTFPDKVKNRLKFRNLCKMGGKYYYIPQDGGTIIANACGYGNTLLEAQAEALAVAETLDAEGVYYEASVFDNLDEVLEKARKIGCGF